MENDWQSGYGQPYQRRAATPKTQKSRQPLRQVFSRNVSQFTKPIKVIWPLAVLTAGICMNLFFAYSIFPGVLKDTRPRQCYVIANKSVEQHKRKWLCSTCCRQFFGVGMLRRKLCTTSGQQVIGRSLPRCHTASTSCASTRLHPCHQLWQLKILSSKFLEVVNSGVRWWCFTNDNSISMHTCCAKSTKTAET